MSGVALIVLALLVVGFVLAFDALTRPARSEWSRQDDRWRQPPLERGGIFAPARPEVIEEQIDDQVRDRRPPRNHARVRR